LAALNGFGQARRDDIESLGLTLIYLMHRGTLPWYKLNYRNKEEKEFQIKELMNSISIE